MPLKIVFRLIVPLVLIAAFPVAVGVQPAAAGLQYGPDTCASGYVWRETTPDDHVCVDPAVRDQAAADNAAAADRVDPYGAYGPDTCIAGYVWREATPDDHVCVEPEVRAQAAADNARADERRATAASDGLGIWVNTYNADPGAGCDGDVCTSTSSGDVPRLKVSGQGFTVGGDVYIGIFRPNADDATEDFETTARSYSGFADGSFGFRTGVFVCGLDPSARTNFEVRAYDWATDSWTDAVPITVCNGAL